MTTTSTAATHPVPRTYRSSPHALVWFFRKSRNNWKNKCLAVKKQLRLANRRLARLAKTTRLSPASRAPSAKGVAAPPSCLAALHQEMLDLRPQVQANRELLEQGQRQHREILRLARQIQHLATNTPALARPLPVQAPQPRSPVSHQAPPEPKKGAPRQHNR